LLISITKETILISQSDAALIYLLDEQDDLLKVSVLCDKNNKQILTDGLSAITQSEIKVLIFLKPLLLQIDPIKKQKL